MGSRKSTPIVDVSGVAEWIDDYRNLFSKDNIGIAGKKSDSKICTEKMVRFMTTFGIDRDTILKATKMYIDHTRRTNGFFREAHYFIFKKMGKEEISDLKTWCGETDQKKMEFGSDI